MSDAHHLPDLVEQFELWIRDDSFPDIRSAFGPISIPALVPISIPMPSLITLISQTHIVIHTLI
jgi:hypothetical protein